MSLPGWLAFVGVLACAFALGWLAHRPATHREVWFCVASPGPQIVCHKGRP